MIIDLNKLHPSRQSMLFVWDSDPLNPHNRKRDEIEDNSNVNSSKNFIKDPSNFMEQTSI
jgi:hypothetical protein